VEKAASQKARQAQLLGRSNTKKKTQIENRGGLPKESKIEVGEFWTLIYWGKVKGGAGRICKGLRRKYPQTVRGKIKGKYRKKKKEYPQLKR